MSTTTSVSTRAGRQATATALLLLAALWLVASGCYAGVHYRSRSNDRTTSTSTTYHPDGSTTTTTTTTTTGWVYYPDVYVYYNPFNGVYFYYDDGQWIETYTLPQTLKIHLGRGIRLSYTGRRPYANYHAHYSSYRPTRTIYIRPRYVPPPTYRYTPPTHHHHHHYQPPRPQPQPNRVTERGTQPRPVAPAPDPYRPPTERDSRSSSSHGQAADER